MQNQIKQATTLGVVESSIFNIMNGIATDDVVSNLFEVRKFTKAEYTKDELKKMAKRVTTVTGIGSALGAAYSYRKARSKGKSKKEARKAARRSAIKGAAVGAGIGLTREYMVHGAREYGVGVHKDIKKRYEPLEKMGKEVQKVTDATAEVRVKAEKAKKTVVRGFARAKRFLKRKDKLRHLAKKGKTYLKGKLD